MKEILSIPINSKGVLIECGSFEGASTSVMSIGAKLINKKLIVYDFLRVYLMLKVPNQDYILIFQFMDIILKVCTVLLKKLLKQNLKALW